ncbi:glycosyltransferase [Nitrosococcus wardiae]|uniref:Glycosyl transferase family 1 n=1 Tax=Nitrosococcus wardiae TaxID=1814290 RepID=A0A4P7BYP5_9GAMM|nr:nucleotide disphospho-sugar-binding domain-containing protein [Nitrosococcus wardiae]QBQ54467.1 glycosyl transferase family 1 [Nitrosococcus wardiae]
MNIADHRKRILFVAEAVTLAHVTRLAELAGGLDLKRYEIFFACDNSSKYFHPQPTFTHFNIHSISPKLFRKALEKGSPLYNYETLKGYVQEDLRILDKIKPDLVVGDFRLSLAVSAPQRKIPYAAVTNAYWSPYYIERWAPFPEHLLGRILGVTIASALFRLAQPIVFARHARAMNRLRETNGLPPLGDLRHVYTHGDYTLYLDVPSLVPIVNAPSNHYYLGPIVKAPSISLPDWWDEVPADQPCVYVSFGSSGAVEKLLEVIKGLSEIRPPLFLMISTAGRTEINFTSKNIRAASYIRGSDAARLSQLVISNGGTTAGYQALAEGVPVLGIPSNMDQYLAQMAITKAGAGRLLRAGKVNALAVRNASSEILNSTGYYTTARRLAAEFTHYDAIKNFCAFVDKVLTK